MKKKLFVLALLIIFIPYFIYAEEDAADDADTQSEEITEEESDEGLNLASEAKSAIMIEASTGKIIYEKNSDEQLPMASMTKMMIT